jgi:hypothetical protein
MKYVILALTLTFAAPAFAARSSLYETVQGLDALKDQYLNQYNDVSNPPQHYSVKLPADHILLNVEVKSPDGNTICGISDYDSRNQTFKIMGYSLETDEQGCEVHLRILNRRNRQEFKPVYTIEQIGT